MSQTGSKISRRNFVTQALGISAVAMLSGPHLLLPEHTLGTSVLPKPLIYSCDDWGAAPPRKPVLILNKRPTTIVVHHTAGSNTSDKSQEHAFQLARSIQSDHMNRPATRSDPGHYIDSGQNFTISRGRYVMEGRHKSLQTLFGGTSFVEGAHCGIHNGETIGIENEGNYSTGQPTPELYTRLVEMCTFACQQYGLPSSAIVGHKDLKGFESDQCPGDNLHALLPQLRKDVDARLRSAGTIISPPPSPPQQGSPNSGSAITVYHDWPLYSYGSRGEKVKAIQYLLRAHGYNLNPDGSFLSITVSNLKSFQQTRGLKPVDGIVENKTWESLVIPVSKGSKKEAVRAAQTLLVAHSYRLEVDGIFGPASQSAVIDYQANKECLAHPTGIVNLSTWHELIKY